MVAVGIFDNICHSFGYIRPTTVYFRLVGCHLGFSTRGSVGHDCWTCKCFVHSHKPLYWFWNDMCIFKNNEVITTSGNL